MHSPARPRPQRRQTRVAEAGTPRSAKRRQRSHTSHAPRLESKSLRQDSMEMASSSGPSTSCSYPNLSLAQAVVTLSINVILVWLTAVIKSSSSSSSASARRREAAPSAAAPPSPSSLAKPATAAGAIDMGVVLGVMGAGDGAASVGFEEAAALFDEEEATVEEAQAAFAVFDRDGDGFIDAGELATVLRSLGFGAGVAAAECQRMIDAYDEDRDGRIDLHEFVKLMERSH